MADLYASYLNKYRSLSGQYAACQNIIDKLASIRLRKKERKDTEKDMFENLARMLYRAIFSVKTCNAKV